MPTKTRPRARRGKRPRQKVRLATEAAGAEDVVDRSSPSEADVASHRSTHGQGSLAHQNADRSVAIPLPGALSVWSRDPTRLRPVRNKPRDLHLRLLRDDTQMGRKQMTPTDRLSDFGSSLATKSDSVERVPRGRNEH